MDFKDEIKSLSDRLEKLLPNIQTEEATKNALIMPFIKILGYDVFNPFEVNPEFIADLGIKKGEKVDYAIIKDEKPIILIECKHHAQSLDIHNSQLFRYFHVTNAKFALLTNGIEFRFYTDLLETNKMDEKPFLVFNLRDPKDVLIEEVKKFHKSYFNVESITATASELKYVNETKILLSAELSNPSPEFVKFIGKQVYNGPMVEKVVNQFTAILKKSSSQLINDLVNDRLKAALAKEEEKSQVDEKPTQPIAAAKIETTEEEKEAYLMVRGILREFVSIDRIFFRDNQSYFTVLIDNNNRRQVCRLHFNGTKKYLGIFVPEEKDFRKFEILKLDDIYNFKNELISAAKEHIHTNA